ncbi:MAG: hypothetical protein HY748_00035 [Elusimicrobia bacterium]|nr:hypothetical protein [Elusimicrobiota bacterium]
MPMAPGTCKGALAVALALCLAAEPGLVAAQTVLTRVQPVSASNLGGMTGAAVQAAGFRGSDLRLSGPSAFGALPALPGLLAAPAPASADALPVAIPIVEAQALEPAVVAVSPLAEASPQTVSETASELTPRLESVTDGIAEAGESLKEAPAETASLSVARQFNLLTGERWAQPGQEDSASPDPSPSGAGLKPSEPRVGDVKALETPAPSAQEKPAETQPKKSGWFKVFREPERNQSFWRYVAGYSVYIFGIEMYVVGLPYLISSFTRNLLRENNDARVAGEEAIRDLVRENRSLARIAHWVAQAFSYASTPIFTRHPEQGPKKWLVRSFLIRAGIIMMIPTLFFASGLFSLQAALWTLFGLIAAQSFFQGLSVTMESAATARIMGDESVTDAERTRANSILTFLGAVVAIIGPALAGQISLIQQLFGKTGVGGAVIYGIYGIAAGIAAGRGHGREGALLAQGPAPGPVDRAARRRQARLPEQVPPDPDHPDPGGLALRRPAHLQRAARVRGEPHRGQGRHHRRHPEGAGAGLVHERLGQHSHGLLRHARGLLQRGQHPGHPAHGAHAAAVP